MNGMDELAARYIDVWNEPDAARRRDLLEACFAVDATYADPLMRASGRQEIDALVAGVHERFPGFRFTLDGTADGHGENLRFSWTLGPRGTGGDDAPIRGTDFAEIRDGRFVRVTGFLDRVPETA